MSQTPSSTTAKPTTNAYQARDVVNAPAIKQAIAVRSSTRGDAPEIAAWLANHFCRHVIGNLQAEAPVLQRIANTHELQELLGRKEAPAWALERLAKKASGFDLPDLWWIVPDAPAVLALENRLVEFLSTRKGTSLEGKLQRVNAPQALARWTLEHLAFKKKQSSGRVEHSKEAVRGLLPGQQGIFFELDSKSASLRQEMAYESQMMGHCVGQFADRRQFKGGYGEHYAEGLESGKMRLFSYRTGSAQPRITINAFVQKDGLLQVEQIKGKQNRPPIARYVPDVVTLLNHLPLNDEAPEDALAMGIVRRPAEMLAPGQTPWCAVEDLQTEPEQLWLMQQYPEMMSRLEMKLPLIQWMVAARKDTLAPEVLEHMPKSQALKTTLQQAKKRPTRTGSKI